MCENTNQLCDFGCGLVATYYKFPSDKTPNGRYSCCVSPNSCTIKRQKTTGDSNPSKRPEIRKKISDTNKIIFAPGSDTCVKQQKLLMELYGVNCPSKIQGVAKKIVDKRKAAGNYKYRPEMNSEGASIKRTRTKISKGIQIPEESLSEFVLYKRKVRKLTEIAYITFLWEINPMGLLRGRKIGEYQLDHIVSVHYGFMNKISPEIISHPSNLRIITSTENKMKSRGSALSLEELMMNIKEFSLSH